MGKSSIIVNKNDVCTSTQHSNSLFFFFRDWQTVAHRPNPPLPVIMARKLALLLRVLNDYILNRYINIHITSLILPLGPQSLKYLSSGPLPPKKKKKLLSISVLYYYYIELDYLNHSSCYS